VYTSTVGVHRRARRMESATKSSRLKLAHMAGDYKAFRNFWRRGLALEFARARGSRWLIVNPTAPLGDHDVKPTPTGKDRARFPERENMPAFYRYRAERGRCARYRGGTLAGPGEAAGGAEERYILGSENLTLAQILQKNWPRSRGRKAPTIRLPYAMAYCAGACSTAWAGFYGNAAARCRWKRCGWRRRKCG